MQIESIARTDPHVAHVFLRNSDGVVLRVPLRATSLSTLVDHSPRTTLNHQSVTQFLQLVKEYALCQILATQPTKASGIRSARNNNKMS